MNRKQTIAMWIGILVFALMGLYPPWRGNTTGREFFIGYDSILQSEASPFKIDTVRLFVQWAMVAVITSGIITTLRDKKSPQSDLIINDNEWEGPSGDYPPDLLRLIRKQLKEKVPGLTEKFNTKSHYFGYSTGKDRAYIYVYKKDLRIDLDISQDIESDLKEEGFEVHFVNNFQGQVGWLTGWRVPHTTSIERVMKWLLKAFNEDE